MIDSELRERVIKLLEEPDVAGQWMHDSSGELQIFGCSACCREDGHAEDCGLQSTLADLKAWRCMSGDCGMDQPYHSLACSVIGTEHLRRRGIEGRK